MSNNRPHDELGAKNIKDMKRILISIGIGLAVILFLCLVLLRPFSRIEHDIKENISIAQQRYPGTTEDALIAFLVDTTNSPHDRGLAIYTLGQINSKKALPILKGLYRNDPKGKTCHGKHDSVLCQKGIHTAIETIEYHYYPEFSGPVLKK
jgi:hypothetical protein